MAKIHIPSETISRICEHLVWIIGHDTY